VKDSNFPDRQYHLPNLDDPFHLLFHVHQTLFLRPSYGLKCGRRRKSLIIFRPEIRVSIIECSQQISVKLGMRGRILRSVVKRQKEKKRKTGAGCISNASFPVKYKHT
jgi:hypothetical protein